MIKHIIFSFFLFILASCDRKGDSNYTPEFSSSKKVSSAKQEIIFAPHPLHNPIRLQEMFGPIIDILNRDIPAAHFTLEASKNYTEFNEKIKSKRIDLLLPNPYQTILATKYDYQVFGKMADDFNFKGIVLVRNDSLITKIKDLKGKVIAFPAPTAVAASMMPLYFLQKNGVNVKNNEIKAKYVGTQESSILAVYYKEVDAAATWPMTWNSFSSEKIELKKELRVLFSTEPLINNSLMVKNDLDKALLDKIKKVLFSLQDSEEGKVILSRMKLSKFESSSNAQYKVAIKFFNDFKLEFGSIPQ